MHKMKMLLLVEEIVMTENKSNKTFYKKIICVSIMIAIAVYCIPELQEKFIEAINFIKSEWRKQK